MSESRIAEAFAFIIGYVILSIIIMMLNGYTLSAWLGFNVALAVIPFIIIQYLTKRLDKLDYKFDLVNILLMVLFVVFLPNTFYVITDMIHIDSSDFYRISYETTVYKDFIEPYMLIFHIFISAVIGTFMGVKCLILFDDIVVQRTDDKKLKGIIFVTLLVLSSIGIYIGRFLRVFSWEILNPVKLFSQVLDSVDLFMITFVITFTIVQYLFYYGYKLVFEKEPF